MPVSCRRVLVIRSDRISTSAGVSFRAAWGRGYATEAAKASLRDAFERVHLQEVLAYTSADNVRSQAVIRRLDMQRAASLDYSEPVGKGAWRELVWMARPSDGLGTRT